MDTILKDRLLNEMQSYFGRDAKRINHAKRVLEFAERILEREANKDINELVITASAILHDIGIHECEKKYNSTAGHLQEKEGPAIAASLMQKLNIDEESIKEVCDIIANHHSPGKIDTLNFKILYDADWLVNLKDEYNLNDKDRLEKTIKKIFFTDTAKDIAKNIYL